MKDILKKLALLLIQFEKEKLEKNAEKRQNRINYLNERKRLKETELDQDGFFNKTMLILASGAFGVTLIFIDKIVSGAPQYKWLLITAWSLYLASIIFSIISLSASRKAYMLHIDKHEALFNLEMRNFEEESEEELEEVIGEVNEEIQKCKARTGFLNTTGLIIFVLATVSIIIFSGINF